MEKLRYQQVTKNGRYPRNFPSLAEGEADTKKHDSAAAAEEPRDFQLQGVDPDEDLGNVREDFFVCLRELSGKSDAKLITHTYNII